MESEGEVEDGRMSSRSDEQGNLFSMGYQMSDILVPCFAELKRSLLQEVFCQRHCPLSQLSSRAGFTLHYTHTHTGPPL